MGAARMSCGTQSSKAANAHWSRRESMGCFAKHSPLRPPALQVPHLRGAPFVSQRSHGILAIRDFAPQTRCHALPKVLGQRPAKRIRGKGIMKISFALCAFSIATWTSPQAQAQSEFQITDSPDQIKITSSTLEAGIRKKSYVTGVYGGTFVDKKTGFHDAGFGLDIVDWIMEPGSDEAYRDKLTGDLPYVFGDRVHGQIPKRSIEGPQICTKAREVSPRVIRGSDFVAVQTSWQYT